MMNQLRLARVRLAAQLQDSHLLQGVEALHTEAALRVQLELASTLNQEAN